MKKVGIALSGGGSRGIAHLGILKALDELNVKVTALSGTSAGAIIGMFYCCGYSPDSIMKIVKETKLIRYVRPAVSFSGLLKLEKVADIFRKYIKVNNFDELHIPLTVSATNINEGKNALISEGDLISAVLASSAVPVIFEPIKLNGHHYVDGGILNNLPVEPLIKTCDVIIGSNCNPVSESYKTGNMKSLLERSLLMAIGVNTSLKRELCDIFLEPVDLKIFGGFDFTKANDIYKIGYEFGMQKLPEIKKLI